MKRGPDAHWAACPSFGRKDGECRGCIPREAVGDSLICGRCFGRTRGLLQGSPDMLAHLRSLTDQLKGTDYAAKRDSAGGSARAVAPPPVPVELFDAADYIVTVLWSTSEMIAGRLPVGRMQVPVAADAVQVLDYADGLVADILPGLQALSERPEVVPLVDAVIGRPASSDEWTLATIFERWSVVEDPWWAAQSCPVCDLRAIKVHPPKTPGDETKYRCASCTWVAPDDVDGFWAEAFSRREGKAA